MFQLEVNQTLMESVMEGFVQRTRSVDFGDGKGPVLASLADLGFRSIGLDDNWQACGNGTNGSSFHDEDGMPMINLNTFPDLKGMVDKAHRLNLTAGWYG